MSNDFDRRAVSELTGAASELVELLDDYMIVSSLSANDRYADALERLRAAMIAANAKPARDENASPGAAPGSNGPVRDGADMGGEEYADDRDFTPPYEP